MSFPNLQIALEVLRYLDPTSLRRVGQVCQSWKMLSSSDRIWNDVCNSTLFNGDVEVLRSQFERDMGLGAVSSRDIALQTMSIRVGWKSRSLPPSKELDAHRASITCLEMACENCIISGSGDKTLRVWSISPFKCLETLSGHAGGVWCCAVSGDNIISGDTVHAVKVWSLSTFQLKRTLLGHTSTVRCLKIVGNCAVSGSRDRELRVWDVGTGECMAILRGHTDAVRCVEFDGETVVSGSYDFTVKIWRPTFPEAERLQFNLVPPAAYCAKIYSLQFNGEVVVTGSVNGSIIVWDAQTGELKFTLLGHTNCTGHMQLRGDILVSGNLDHTVRTWNVRTGICIHVLGGSSGKSGHTGYVTHVGFVNADNVISCSSDGSVKLWDLNTGKWVRNLVDLNEAESTHKHIVWRTAYDDGRLVCAYGEHARQEEGGMYTGEPLSKLLALNFNSSSYLGGVFESQTDNAGTAK